MDPFSLMVWVFGMGMGVGGDRDRGGGRDGIRKERYQREKKSEGE